MCHRIRYSMEATGPFPLMRGTVEADETYIGGKIKRSRGAPLSNKTPVVTLVNRGGEARSLVMRQVTGENIEEVLHKNVDPTAALMTDESSLYTAAGQSFASHETVNHSAGEYVRGNIYSNTAERFFSQLKRSVDGTHHHVSEYHLPRCVAEFDFRYSNRKIKDGERTVKAITQSAGKRLMYHQTIS